MSIYVADQKRYEKISYPRCGRSGLKLPAVSLGLWHNFGETGNYENMKQMCRTAFDGGITHFDLANNYGPTEGAAEKSFGRIMKEDLKPYRDEIIVSTKAGYFMNPGPYGDWGSRKYLLSSLDASLLRMGLDYVDIFYHHRPDPETPLEETMGALAHAVNSGKALYVGLSNYNGEQLIAAEKILREMRVPFIINQNRYSMLDRTIEKNGLKAASHELGKGIIVFSPLEQGLLTERYFDGVPSDSRMRTDGRFLTEKALKPELMEKLHKLAKIAHERGQTLAEMALSWCLRDGIVTSVLVGASKPSQITENLNAVKNTVFSAEELAEIDKITQ
ncbi:MAG: aldo/keto reductase [Clostridia bacterium]|nr:aldo/keto reductase [Clostridia bacterium]